METTRSPSQRPRSASRPTFPPRTYPMSTPPLTISGHRLTRTETVKSTERSLELPLHLD